MRFPNQEAYHRSSRGCNGELHIGGRCVERILYCRREFHPHVGHEELGRACRRGNGRSTSKEGLLPTRREVLRLAERIASVPTVSYHEHAVLARIREECDRIGVAHASDRSGNLIARYRGPRARGRPVALSSHTDHPGLVILKSEGRRATARWIGGVLPRYFPRARVRVETAQGPVRGVVEAMEIGENGRVVHVGLRLARDVPAGSIGGWDLIPFRRDGETLLTKSADDLFGCAAQLALLGDLARERPPLEVWAIFTRAEEDGLFGAIALAEDRSLPAEVAVVVLETSKELPCGRIGRGPVVRVGDRRSVFDPGVSQILQGAAEDLAKAEPGFRYQRGLMDGGVCEATVYQAFGYASGGLALPLGNYHNMGPTRIGEEFVHVEDLYNLARLLPVAVRRLAHSRSPLDPIRAGLRRRLPAARRTMEATRSHPPAAPGQRRRHRGSPLFTMILALVLGVPAARAVLPDWAGDPEMTPTAKHSAPPIALVTERPSLPDPRDDYDALRYDLLLRIDPSSERISGRLTMTFEALSGLDALRLDLDATLVADSARCETQPCDLSRPEPNQIEIDLPSVVEAGDSGEVTLSYAGDPGDPFFSGFDFFSVHGEPSSSFPIVASLSQPDRARGWWPCKDLMDDKAIVSVTVEAPEGFDVAGNGMRTLTEPAGDGIRVRWESRYPISTYLVSFAATNYARWTDVFEAADGDSISLEYYAYPESEADARADYQVTPEALAVFESRFGPYPFRDRAIGWEKLGVAQFEWGSGAMEHQTCVSYGEGFITGDRTNDWALAHEIAHQWWGDMVTPTTMEHIWLNEGFATYSEALLMEARDGAPGYRRWLLRMRAHAELDYEGTIVTPTYPFNLTVYRKGAWFLHMLRGLLGTERFFEVLSVYRERYRYSNASTADFLRAVEETVGEDLRDFAIPWLYGTGRPALAWEWWPEGGEAGSQVRLQIEQTQPDDPSYPVPTPMDDPPDAFAFPLEVRAFAGGDSATRIVSISSRRHVVVLDFPFRPDSLALDPDHWVLREIAPRGTGLPAAPLLVWPNPAREEVRVLAHHPGSDRAGLAVYDLAGRKIRDLGSLEGIGRHIVTWDGRNEDGRQVASGLYFVRLEGSGQTNTARIVFAR